MNYYENWVPYHDNFKGYTYDLWMEIGPTCRLTLRCSVQVKTKTAIGPQR